MPPSPTDFASPPVGPVSGLLPRHRAWLLAATVVAAALRIWHVGTWSLWIDEAHTWRDATMALTGPNGFLASDRAWYPLPFLLLRALLDLQWLGEDEASLRLPFVVAGIVTVPLVGWCGRRLVGPGPAVFAAWLVAMDPWHVYWSQNARGYVLVVLAAVLVVDRMHAFATTRRRRHLVATAALVLLAVASHATGALLALAAPVFLALRRCPRFGPRMLLAALLVVVALAFVLTWLVAEYSPFQGFLRAKRDTSTTHFVTTVAYYFRPVVLVAAAVGLLLLARVMGREPTLLLVSFAVVPLLVLLVVGSLLAKTTARYAIGALPVVAWLAASGAAGLGGALRRVGTGLPVRFAAAAVPAILVADHVQQLVAYHGVQQGQRPPWRDAAAFVRDRAGGRPVRVLTTNSPTLLYYLRPGHWRERIPDAFYPNEVRPLIEWMVVEGVDESRTRMHAPGAAAHLDWHREAARSRGALFAVVVTMPELLEQDRSGALRAELARDFAPALHLPCWVGPKDESIHVYLPREP